MNWGLLMRRRGCSPSVSIVVCTVHTGHCAWWEEWAVAQVQPRQCRCERRRPPQQKARLNGGKCRPIDWLPNKGCAVQFHRRNEFRGERMKIDVRPRTASFWKGRSPLGVSRNTPASYLWALFGVAWGDWGSFHVDRADGHQDDRPRAQASPDVYCPKRTGLAGASVGMTDRSRVPKERLRRQTWKAHSNSTSSPPMMYRRTGYQHHCICSSVPVCLCTPGNIFTLSGWTSSTDYLVLSSICAAKGQSKGQVQCRPNKPLAGVAALAPAYVSLVAFRKGRRHQQHLGRWGHSPSVDPDSGPMIVSRPQFPKGSSCSASCTQSQRLLGAMTRGPKTRPDRSNAGLTD